MYEEMPIYGSYQPEVLIAAESTEDVSNIMTICNEEKIPVVARGAGSGLVGSGVAINGGVMIDMQSMNKILDYDLDNIVASSSLCCPRGALRRRPQSIWIQQGALQQKWRA